MRRLEAVQRELDCADRPAEWIRLDRCFHDELYGPSGRLRTLEMIARLRGAVERFNLVRLGPDVRRVAWNGEHQQLIAAVRARDIEAANAILSTHLRQTQQSALASIDRLLTPT